MSWISELTHDFPAVLIDLENHPKRKELIKLQLEDEVDHRYYLNLLFSFISKHTVYMDVQHLKRIEHISLAVSTI